MKKALLFMSFKILILTIASSQTPLENIPLTVIKKYLFVPISINNSHPLYFLLDSGAGGTVMNDSTAKAIGLQRENETFNTGANGITRTWSCNNNRLQLGTLVIENITISALPLSSLSDFFGIPVAGITGYDIFSRHISETNIDSQKLYLWKQHAFHKRKEDEVIDFIISDNNLIYSVAEFTTSDNRTIKLKTVIDSGSGRFLSIYGDAVEKYGLLDKTRNYQTTTERGTENIPLNNYIDTLPQFKIGSFIHHNIRMILATGSPNTVSTASHKIEALLGQGILFDYNITYDYFNKKMYWQRRKTP